MKKRNYIVAISLAPFILLGCVNAPINARTAQHYYDWGTEAEDGGNLQLARRNFYRCYQNTQWGYMSLDTQALALYEWSRVSGYLGLYEDSEKGFTEVLRLLDKAKGQAETLRAPTLNELARLFHDTGQHQKAVPIYEKAIAELDRTNIETTDPIGFSMVLDDYAESLRLIGETEQADKITSRSTAIKQSHKGEQPEFVARRYRNP